MQDHDVQPLPDKDQASLGVRLIQEERRWRERPTPIAVANGPSPRITLSHWTGVNHGIPVEVSSDSVDDAHIISFAVRKTEAELHIGNVQLKSGFIPERTMLISGPINQPWTSVLYQQFSFLQVHFPQQLMAECHEYVNGRPPASDLVLFEPQYIRDITIENLVQSLVGLDDWDNVLASMYLDSIGIALATRLFAYIGVVRAPATKKKGGLAKWRLARTMEYIEAHLTRPIHLADLSQVSGLSRMHFAAQFRESIGVSPHSYVLRRRIALAQELLRSPSFRIVDVALATGFSSQAHFGDVFKRFVGQTPRQWRDAQKAGRGHVG